MLSSVVFILLGVYKYFIFFEERSCFLGDLPSDVDGRNCREGDLDQTTLHSVGFRVNFPAEGSNAVSGVTS